MNFQDLTNHIIVFDEFKNFSNNVEIEVKKRKTKNFLFLIKSLIQQETSDDALTIILNTMINSNVIRDGEKAYIFRPENFSFDLDYANHLVDSKGNPFVPRVYTDVELLNVFDDDNRIFNNSDEMYGIPKFQPIVADMLALIVELFTMSKKPREHIGMKILTNTLIENRVLVSVFDPAHKTSKNFKELFEK